MRPCKPFVDIHCHLLADIDDGAIDWNESLAMARMAVADGISTIIATPHQLGAFGHNDGRAVRREVERFGQLLGRHGIPLRVLPGADVRVEPGLVEKIRAGQVVTLADRRRHVLLELPHELYLPLDRPLAQLGAAGLVGVLSHPERNRGILQRRDVVLPLVRRGCLMQVTAGSLVGAFGPEVAAMSKWLVQRGLVHFVASDAHGAKHRRPLLCRAFQRVAQLTDSHTAHRLFCDNPARVAAGQDVSARTPPSRRSRVAAWFGWRKAG